jgi:hypothetical protein
VGTFFFASMQLLGVTEDDLKQRLQVLTYTPSNGDPTAPGPTAHVWQPPWTGGLAPKLVDARSSRFLEDILAKGLEEKYMVQEKLDGHMLAFTGAYALTKKGNPYEGIPDAFWRYALPRGIPLIGELYRGPGWTNDSLTGVSKRPSAKVARLDNRPAGGRENRADRDARTSATKHASKWYFSKYVVFDVPGMINTPYEERWKLLQKAVTQWNEGIVNAEGGRVTQDQLPLQCVCRYDANKWPELLREVIMQPVIRKFPPYGAGTEGQRMAPPSTGQTQNTQEEFSPAGEGLVFHHRYAGWIDRDGKHKGPPSGVKLKPRLLMPARVTSVAPRLWGETDEGKRGSFGYKITVAYWHPGTCMVAHQDALIPVSSSTRHNAATIAQQYGHNQLVFLTVMGVRFSSGTLRAHPIAHASLQSWHAAAITAQLVKCQAMLRVTADQQEGLLRALGRDKGGHPIATDAPAALRTKLLSQLCQTATVFPLHPVVDINWWFQRLLYTPKTHSSVQLRHLLVAQEFQALARSSLDTQGGYLSRLRPGVPQERRMLSIPVTEIILAVRNWKEKRVLYFAKIMHNTAQYIRRHHEDTASFLRPICEVARGSYGALARGLVSRWCHVAAHGAPESEYHHYVYLCQCIILTCCARIWADVEGNYEVGYTSAAHTQALRRCIDLSVDNVCAHWNNWWGGVMGGVDGWRGFTIDEDCGRRPREKANACYGPLDYVLHVACGPGDDDANGVRLFSRMNSGPLHWKLTIKQVHELLHKPGAQADTRLLPGVIANLQQRFTERKHGDFTSEDWFKMVDGLPVAPVVHPRQERVQAWTGGEDRSILHQLLSLDKL